MAVRTEMHRFSPNRTDAPNRKFEKSTPKSDRNYFFELLGWNSHQRCKISWGLQKWPQICSWCFGSKDTALRSYKKCSFCTETEPRYFDLKIRRNRTENYKKAHRRYRTENSEKSHWPRTLPNNHTEYSSDLKVIKSDHFFTRFQCHPGLLSDRSSSFERWSLCHRV